MTVLGIDHLVIAVRDPDAAATTLDAELGLRASGWWAAPVPRHVQPARVAG